MEEYGNRRKHPSGSRKYVFAEFLIINLYTYTITLHQENQNKINKNLIHSTRKIFSVSLPYFGRTLPHNVYLYSLYHRRSIYPVTFDPFFYSTITQRGMSLLWYTNLGTIYPLPSRLTLRPVESGHGRWTGTKK